MAEVNDDLFGNLDSKMTFLNEQSKVNSDGIYRVDLSKVQDKKKGYHATVRFLPNLTKDGKVGQAAIEKITHYVDIKDAKELSGWFDSPKNVDPATGKKFAEKCPLTDLFYAMKNSKNAILQEKAEMLKYSKKYYSYVLVIEDEQQPELVGKIMIFQYGKTIKDKIAAEKTGEISGEPCNVFDLSTGKDFKLIVKEIQTGEIKYPDYKMSSFKQSTSLPVFKDGVFKNVPLGADGKVDPKAQNVVKTFLMTREHDLEEFAPKKLSEEQQGKITDISNYLTGKASTSFTKKETPKSDDFEFEDNFATPSSGASNKGADDEDDFFDDL
jgi:hypothetical protein